MTENSQNDNRFAEENTEKKRDRNEIKFTHLTIKHLKAQKKQKIFWCQGMTGFGVDVSPRGSKTWVFQYRINNKCRRMVLGKFPRMSLGEAIKAYSNMNSKVEHGIDPLMEKNLNEKKKNKEPTVKELSEKYIQYCIAKKEVSWIEKQRVINKELLPFIGNKKVSDVTFREIAKIVNDIYVERNTPTQAQRLLSHARCMFRYAKNSLGVIETNPCADLQAPKNTQKKKRVLDSKEIYLFWHNIDYTLMSPVVRSGLKFMLCTMARGVEVRKAKWEHINFQDKTWLIPSENAKNRRELLLSLNRYALEILEDIKELTGHSELIFGHHSTMNYGELKKEYKLTVMGSTAFSHAMRDNFHLFNIEKRFTPHDLRRTAATCLTSVGYPKEWVGKLLNHTPKGVTSAVYDSFDYFEEKRAGMEAVQYILDRILSAKNVEQVSSLRSLRKEFFRNKLIYQFLDEGHYDPRIEPAHNLQGHSSNSSDLVSYSLSYVHNELVKPD